MAVADIVKSLRDIEFAELRLDNVGSWPLPIKVFAWTVVFGLVCFLGYSQHLESMRLDLDKVRVMEVSLRKQYEDKQFQVANLETLKAQLAEMEKQFGALLSQLPKDT